MKTAREIIADIGQKTAEGKLGVGYKSIHAAISKGVFPSSWYAILKKECEAIGVECPTDLFSFIVKSEDMKPDE